MGLPIVVKDGFALGCADSVQQDVDLSALIANVDYTVTPAANVVIDGVNAVTSLTVAATPATAASITTSVIDGSTVVCTALAGALQGSSTNATSEGKKFCLADADITAATVASYAGNGSVGTLTASWSNTSSGATGAETLTAWFADAGQSYVEVE